MGSWNSTNQSTIADGKTVIHSIYFCHNFVRGTQKKRSQHWIYMLDNQTKPGARKTSADPAGASRLSALEWSLLASVSENELVASWRWHPRGLCSWQAWDLMTWKSGDVKYHLLLKQCRLLLRKWIKHPLTSKAAEIQNNFKIPEWNRAKRWSRKLFQGPV